MRIPNRAGILVTDGSKMMLLRNDGDADFPNLTLIDRAVDDNPPDRMQKSDAAGSAAFRGNGGGRSVYDEGDVHRDEEVRFAKKAADTLGRCAADGAFEALIVVADPRTLGSLRGNYGRDVEARLIGEVAKDLTRHPIAEIERVLARC